MCGFVLLFFISCCQFAFGAPQPEAYNPNNNYTYRLGYTYNYSYKLPVQSSSNGEFIVGSGMPQNDFPLVFPKVIQDEFKRQNIPLPAPQLAPDKSDFTQNVQVFHDIQKSREIPSLLGPVVTETFTPILPQSVEPLPPQNAINQSRKSRQDNVSFTGSRFAQEPISAKTDKLPTTLTVNGTNCAYGFCEQADNYPEQIILRLVEGNKALGAFFKPKVPDIGERLNAAFENICEVNKNIVAPKTAQNIEGKNRIVVNVKNYQQIVESEVCRPDSKCKFHNYWPEGYAAKCIQKYVEVPLAVMDEEDNKIIIEKFSYPSGCFCACKSE